MIVCKSFFYLFAIHLALHTGSALNALGSYRVNAKHMAGYPSTSFHCEQAF